MASTIGASDIKAAARRSLQSEHFCQNRTCRQLSPPTTTGLLQHKPAQAATHAVGDLQLPGADESSSLKPITYFASRDYICVSRASHPASPAGDFPYQDLFSHLFKPPKLLKNEIKRNVD